MKKIAVIFLGLVILVGCNQNVNYEDLQIVKGKTMLNNSPFSGEYHRFFENGKGKEICNYKHGIPVGNWISYDNEGQVTDTITYLENTDLQNNLTYEFGCERTDLSGWGKEKQLEIYLIYPKDTSQIISRLQKVVDRTKNLSEYSKASRVRFGLRIYNDSLSLRTLVGGWHIENGKVLHLSYHDIGHLFKQ